MEMSVIANNSAISAVRSTDASSTTMISKSIPLCATRDSRHCARHASSFLAGTITDTTGLLVAEFILTFDMIHARHNATGEPNVYYMYVRFSPAVLACAAALTLSGCYGGSKPKSIGRPAPDFTIQDSDRIISLSQFRGKVVVLNFWATVVPALYRGDAVAGGVAEDLSGDGRHRRRSQCGRRPRCLSQVLKGPQHRSAHYS